MEPLNPLAFSVGVSDSPSNATVSVKVENMVEALKSMMIVENVKDKREI